MRYCLCPVTIAGKSTSATSVVRRQRGACPTGECFATFVRSICELINIYKKKKKKKKKKKNKIKKKKKQRHALTVMASALHVGIGVGRCAADGGRIALSRRCTAWSSRVGYDPSWRTSENNRRAKFYGITVIGSEATGRRGAQLAPGGGRHPARAAVRLIREAFHVTAQTPDRHTPRRSPGP